MIAHTSDVHSTSKKREQIVKLHLTMKMGLGTNGGIKLVSSDSLCLTAEPGVVYATKKYFADVERALTPLARAAINHLCRDLQDISVRVSKDGCQVELIPLGPSADTLYACMCRRVSSPGSRDLPLEVALARDIPEAVDLAILSIGSSASA